jgi:hypothetical protein
MAQREGYLFIDHRASPGLPDDMARRMGILPGSSVNELATLTCCHCGTAVIKNPFRQRERASCPKCSYKYLCDFCAAKTREIDYIHISREVRIDLALKGGADV